jgi:aminoglycoside phosphotransferase (APT) family kinase protein
MTAARLHEHEVAVDERLVRALLEDQHPRWAGSPLERVASSGTDHAIFRLGADLVVRLPRIAWAEQQVDREAAWLPLLAPHLPVAVPEPVAVGGPGHGYPYRWSVNTWLAGLDGLHREAPTGQAGVRVAEDLAELVLALQRVPGDPGPLPGKRGRTLEPHDAAVRQGIEVLVASGQLDGRRATEVWEQALAADPWPGPPVWVHGDLLAGNLLFDDGRLVGVIDWSATGVGDPACDLQAAWWLAPDARARLRDLLEVDDATWARARGWVVEQTVAFIPYYAATLPSAVAAARTRLANVLA